MKKEFRINARASKKTRTELLRLCELWGASQGEVVAILVSEAYEKEKKKRRGKSD